MRILFNMVGCGAANNGGTSTIFNSANILHKLGHKVFLVSDEKNKFTWFKLDGPEYILTDKLDYPHADVVIATGVKSVPYVINAPSFKGKKLWWVRGHENWARSDTQIFSLYRNPNITPFVNSSNLQRWIKRLTGKEPSILRPGTDIDLFYPEKERNWKKKKWVLGGIFNQKPLKRFEWIPLIYEQLKELGYNVELHLFGTYDMRRQVPHDVYLQQPDKEALRKFYSNVDFWIAPTMSEGLHIPPQEAMLCECIVLGTDENLSGMRDYIEDGTTGYLMQYWTDGAEQLARLIDEGDKIELDKIAKAGREKIISLGDRKKNMKKMVKYFKGAENAKWYYR